MTRFLVYLVYLAGGLLLAALLLVAYVRTVGSDVTVWHIDPLLAQRPGKDNDVLVLPPGLAGADIESPLLAGDLRTVSRRIDAVAMRERRVQRLAGNVEVGFVTYLVRSRWVGFPDYVSVKVVPQPDGRMALAIWSRSRFGYSDLGVNRARVERWLSQLQGG